jgi:predicted nucleotidyltransferase
VAVRREMETGMSLADELKTVGARYRIAALYAYGSRAAEIAKRIRRQAISFGFPESDVDIGVQPASGRRLTAQERVRLAVELEELLAAKRVDLVVLPEADPFLALDVIRGELLYCADADQQAEDELYVLRRAGDLVPYAHERWRLILSGTAP